jgi:hypothetical protein
MSHNDYIRILTRQHYSSLNYYSTRTHTYLINLPDCIETTLPIHTYGNCKLLVTMAIEVYKSKFSDTLQDLMYNEI